MKSFLFRGRSLFLISKVGIFLFIMFLICTNNSIYGQKIFTSLTAYSTAAIDANGNLYVWGYDQYKKIGTSTAAPPSGAVPKDSTPVLIAFPSGVNKWVALSTGQAHMIALGDDGNLYAWGFNNHGQLGIGSIVNDSLPVMVTKPTGVTSWTAIACGAFHNIAIGSDQNVYVWGYNNQGQLADSSLTDKLVPTQVALPNSVKVLAVSASNNACLVLASDNALYAWGKNGNGQLGTGTTTDHSTPVAVTLPSGVVPVAISSGGYFNSCIAADGNIYSWGQANNGQIGNGSTSPSNVLIPTMANKPSGVTKWNSYATGASFVFAIGDNGNLYAWGFGGTGEMGNGTATTNNLTPIMPSLPAGVIPVQVAASHNSGFVLDNINNIYSWGRNIEGQLGINNTTNSSTPVKVQLKLALPAAPVVLLPASGTALEVKDTLFVWNNVVSATSYRLQVATDSAAFLVVAFDTTGITDTTYVLSNYFKGKLSDNTKYYWRVSAINSVGEGSFSTIMSFITPNNQVIKGRRLAVQTNARSSYVIDADNKFYAWGDNQFGQLGNGVTTKDSAAVNILYPAGVTKWIKASAGQTHAIALGNDGNLYAWGQNNYGQLGNSSTTNSSTPIMVTKPAAVSNWTDIAAGAYHSIAIGNDGKAYTWGYNNFGQLGNGTSTNSNIPVLVSIPNGVVPAKVFATNNACMILGTNDTLYSWGRNANGQLGNGTTTDSKTPAQVILPTGVKKWTNVAAGGYHVLTIGDDGNLYAWGSCGNGQIGVGSNSGNFPLPQMITKPAGVTNWTTIAAGGNFSMALSDNGDLYGFGYDGNGELGIDTIMSTVSLPAKVNVPPGVSSWKTVTAGWNHCLALDSRDSLYSWGLNSSGQLGNNSTVSSIVPVQIHFFQGPLPSVPVLAEPASDDTLGLNDTDLVWHPVEGATSYRLQIATDSASFTAIACDSTVTADTSIALAKIINTKLTASTKYFWHVSAKNNNGAGVYSTIWSFITPRQMPAPVLASPVSGDTLNPKDTTFVWSSVTGAASYELQIATDSASFSSLAVDSTGIKDTLLVNSNVIKSKLVPGTKYFWHVNAKNSLLTSPYSAVWSFFNPRPALSAPVLAGPVNGDTLGIKDTVFVWQKVAGANSYGLQIATDSASFSSLVIDSTGIADTLLINSNFIKGKLSAGTRYFWRVNAQDSYGVSSYSTIWVFVNPRPSGVASGMGAIPTVYSLSQNYPNPFNPSTIINYSIPKNGYVSLKIYNPLGQEVATLVGAYQKAGSYRVNFNASHLASGIYIYRIHSNEFTSVKKMILAK